MSLQEIEAMSTKDKESFARICAHLMSKNYLLRENADRTPNSDYRFIQRHFEKFEEYLELSCWRIYEDRPCGVIYVRNAEGLNKANLNKLTTQILITLRLIYEEKRTKASDTNSVIVSVGELFVKMIHELSVLKAKPPQKDCKDSFRKLEQHNLIYKLDDSYDDIECRIRILPSIVFAVPNDRCKAVCEALTMTEDTEVENEETD